MAKKKRVYSVAKEYSVSNEALIEFLHDQGFKIRNHMAPVTEEMYALVDGHFHKTESTETREPDFRKRMEIKKEEEEKRREAVREEINEILERSKEGDLEPVSITGKERARKRAEKETKEALKVTDAPPKPKEKPEAGTEKKKEDAKPQAREKARPVTPEVAAIKEFESGHAGDSDKDKPAEKQKRSLKKDVKKAAEQASEKHHPKKRKKKTEEEAPRPKKRTRKIETKETSDDDRKGKKRKKRKKGKKGPRVKIDEKEISASIKETLARMSDTSKKKRRKKEKAHDEDAVEENVLNVTEFVSVAELANLMDVDASDVIKACMSLGLMVTINQRLDREVITMLTHEFGFDVVFLTEYGEDTEEQAIIEEDDDESKQEPRAPVVTIMGHVDHGKTSLLDYIRRSNIIAKESGGITQHIGAYEVVVKGSKITFLDTPGHEAFTAMRARGAQVTDMVVLIVAADDGIMPQTREAINHSRAANVPIVVAVNKMDRPDADADRIKKQLSENNILVEEWGGKVQCVPVSAKTGDGVETLLEAILLEAEMLELTANPEGKARAVIVESRKDKGKGIIGNILVQKGSLHVGDIFVAGAFNGRVRAMLNDQGGKIDEAGPSTPVQVMGFTGMPQAGDVFTVVDSEQEAKDISQKRQQLKREQEFRQVKRLTLDQISRNIAEGTTKELAVILKGDVDGSVEALSDSLMDMSTDQASVLIVHKAVGAINESDVLLAQASEAVIIGFHVQPNSKALDLAKAEHIDIRLYEVIYDVVNDIRMALSGLLEPEKIEEKMGEVEIRNIFKASKIGLIAGCYVLSGKIVRNSFVRVRRDGEEIYDGKLSSLKRFKDDVKEVNAGYECGLTFENFNDMKEGDMLEVYTITEKARVL